MPLLSRRDFIRLAVAGTLAASVADVRAAEELLHLEQAELQPGGDGYVLRGNFVLQFTPMLEETLNRGVVFAFIQAFEAERPRDYWFPEQIAVVRRERQLSYNALLRQYQLQTGNRHEPFDSLSEALHALCDISDWAVLTHAQVSKGMTYQVRLRMYFDPSHLSKPLQLNTFASERWDMDSGWREWTFKP